MTALARPDVLASALALLRILAGPDNTEGRTADGLVLATHDDARLVARGLLAHVDASGPPSVVAIEPFWPDKLPLPFHYRGAVVCFDGDDYYVFGDGDKVLEPGDYVAALSDGTFRCVAYADVLSALTDARERWR